MRRAPPLPALLLQALVPTLASALLAAPAGAQAAEAPRVGARLACSTTGLLPGCANTLAVVLEVPEGWHVYAPCLNDSGLPVLVEPRLPEGWTAEPVSWPPPQRLPEPGELLDHVYTGRVVLPFRIHVPESAAGTAAKAAVHVEWMACKSACVLGHAELALDLPVAALAAAVDESPDANLIRQVHAPRPL